MNLACQCFVAFNILIDLRMIIGTMIVSNKAQSLQMNKGLDNFVRLLLKPVCV